MSHYNIFIVIFIVLIIITILLVNSKEKYSFDQGVASGDPLCDRVIIWTRIKYNHVNWYISKDEDMKTIIKMGKAYTNEDKDWTIKVDVEGLEPNHVYYYQFECNGIKSSIGRTKTLPVGDVEKWNIAVMSCSLYLAGYYHVYEEMAKMKNQIDVALHLGDYIC